MTANGGVRAGSSELRGNNLADGLPVSLSSLVFGKPLRSDAEAEEQIGALEGIPVLGLDALASASYGPEAALTVLLLAGVSDSAAIIPIIGCVIGLLLIVFFSYRQTI